MGNLNDYPELKATFDALQAEKDELRTQTADLRAERDTLKNQANELLAKVRELNEKIAAIEMPRMAQIDRQLSAIARASGGRRMSQPTEE